MQLVDDHHHHKLEPDSYAICQRKYNQICHEPSEPTQIPDPKRRTGAKRSRNDKGRRDTTLQTTKPKANSDKTALKDVEVELDNKKDNNNKETSAKKDGSRESNPWANLCLEKML